MEEITKQLDSEHPTSNPTDKPAENKRPLPWEKGETKTVDEQNKAAAFIASATRRLAKIKKPSSRVASDTTKKSTRLSPSPYSEKQSPKERNLRDLPDLAQQENKTPSHTASDSVLAGSPGEKDAPTNSQLLHDYPGHLIVSLDDGIIRPIEGINAPQRVVLACITVHPGYNVPQISASTGIPQKSIERHISALIDHDLIEHQGSKKTGGYYVK